MEPLFVIVLGLITIAGAAVIGPRVGVATPLLLVIVGIIVSFLPFIPVVDIEPEWILAGILPPLLYSASVSMPAMDFRREFTAIGGLSVVLVVLSSIVLGFFFSLVIPDLGIWWGIALGAVVSPTDAVATSIVKRSGVSGRIVAVLEGESLLNDATALVLLRAAIAGTAASISVWGVLGNFVFAVVVATAIGTAIGYLNLWVRSKISDSTVNTVISFTVPFLASIPAELLGASGLVAAVVAGLVTGRRAPRLLPPQHRVAEAQNWRAAEMVLEGAIFLIMGLELAGIVAEVQNDEANGLLVAAGIALAALVITILVRAAYVTPLIAGLRRRARRGELMKPRLETFQETIGDPERYDERFQGRRTPPSPRRIERGLTRMRRALADIDYFLAAPLGWREGTVVVWAGMRGAVTLAAAQTIPHDAPHRSLLILIAFLVAGSSLLIQGGTLARVVRWVKPATADPLDVEERTRMMQMLDDAAATVVVAPEAGSDAERAIPVDRPFDDAEPLDAASDEPVVWDPFSSEAKRLALAKINAKRNALLDARDDGAFSAPALTTALANLDADQISIELKGGPAG
ncbi:cation:proton antiporter [Plantibacter sp. YIM 135347]|uniref:cation:proton antiporter n=1 Tax=Plantibacter sp. YIM 135347 TaxID=3423919 RepID=UPI003D3564E3